MRETFEEKGRIWFRGALGEDDLRNFDQSSELSNKAGERLDTDALSPTLAKLAYILASLSATSLRPMRVVAFNKSKGANWGVPWHQDRVIAIKEKHEMAGFSNWTRKAGGWHCEPPLDILKPILFVRVHLDETSAESGAMEIARGSHKAGLVRSADAASVARRYPLETCVAQRGDVLALKMLTLHQSGAATKPTTRREFRADFAGFDLPAPMEWAR